MKKNLLFYFAITGTFLLLVFAVLHYGKSIQGEALSISKPGTQVDNIGSFEIFQGEFADNLGHPLSILLLQIITIIIVARIFGFLFRKIGQPKVIGEILAGIVLGPSLIGTFFPEISVFLFPEGSFANLQFLSQIGLILFMFIIGMELDTDVVKTKAHDAVVVSHASIIFPFILGMILSLFLYHDFAPANVTYVSFALFMGIAMSITAFPVLARILQERNLTKTKLGSLALTCAAVDDITAWCVLATIIAIVKAGSVAASLYTFGLAISYVLVMLFLVRPGLQRIGSIYASKEILSKTVIAVVFLVLLLSAYIAEVVGIHALFGAFLAGVIMPPNINFKKLMAEKIEDVSVVLLLPLFFVFTGLRTQIGLLNDVNLWVVCLIIIGVAVLGKFGGGAISARYVGQSWKNALSLGTLMNTRGLMELVVLNIGFDLGILSNEVFAMMVIMALSTTMMTGPSLDLINRFFPKDDDLSIIKKPEHGKILISFGPAEMGAKLISLASLLSSKASGNKVKVTALHITPSSEIDPEQAARYEEESFMMVKEKAEELGVTLETKYRATEEVGREIINTSREGEHNLLLVGAAKTLFSENILSGKIKTLLDEIDCSMGIFWEKHCESMENILLIVSDESDNYLVHYVQLLNSNNRSTITVLDTNNIFNDKLNSDPLKISKFKMAGKNDMDHQFIEQFDLIVLSIETWKKSVLLKSEWINYCPSVLIIKKGEKNLLNIDIPNKSKIKTIQA